MRERERERERERYGVGTYIVVEGKGERGRTNGRKEGGREGERDMVVLGGYRDEGRGKERRGDKGKKTKSVEVPVQRKSSEELTFLTVSLPSVSRLPLVLT